MGGQGVGKVAGLHSRRDAQVELGGGAGWHGVDGLVHGGGGEADDRDGGARPRQIGGGVVGAAHELDAVENPGVGTEDLGRVGFALPGGGKVHVIDGGAAVVVAQRVQEPDQRGDGIGCGATETAGVHGRAQGVHGDGGLYGSAEGDGQGGGTCGDVSGIGDEDDVSLEQFGLGADELF